MTKHWRHCHFLQPWQHLYCASISTLKTSSGQWLNLCLQHVSWKLVGLGIWISRKRRKTVITSFQSLFLATLHFLLKQVSWRVISILFLHQTIILSSDSPEFTAVLVGVINRTLFHQLEHLLTELPAVPSSRYMFLVCRLENSGPRKLCILVSMKIINLTGTGFPTSHQALKTEGWSPLNVLILLSVGNAQRATVSFWRAETQASSSSPIIETLLMTTGVSVPTPLVFRGVRTRGMRGSLYSHVHCPFLCSVNSWNDTQLDETQVLNVWTAALSGYTMSRLSDALLTNWCIHSGNSTKGYTWGFMQCCKVFKRPNFFFLFPLRIVSFSLKQESICFIHGCNCVSYFLNQPSCRVLFGSRLGLKKKYSCTVLVRWWEMNSNQQVMG